MTGLESSLPSEDLTVALLQEPINWQDPVTNRRRFAELIKTISQPVDLIVLPEVFTTGFNGDGQAIEEQARGETCRWMSEQARATGAVVTGSLIIAEGDARYNRLVWARPDGSFAEYNKRHLFRMGNEHQRYSAGSERLVVELKGWRVCPLICYDLRFPVFSRNTHSGERCDYDLAIYVANWPDSRAYHWRSLLVARAIENQACVIGVNRIGSDAKGLNYVGDSLCVDARGELLIDMAATEGVAVCTLSADALVQYRARFPAYLDADEFSLIGS